MFGEKPPVHEEDQDQSADVDQVQYRFQGQALWTRDKKSIEDQEHEEFYKYFSNDFDGPSDWIHKQVEGNYSYTMLLYLPKRAPFDLWHREQTKGLKLYVQRVFIMDKVEQFLPTIAIGVIDSSDLLNVSREILQSNRVIDVIKQSATKHVLDLLDKKANDAEVYADFWQQFGNVLKEGIGEDFQNQEKIQKLLRFSSTHDDSGKQSVSLADYVARMPEDQEAIYYVVADSYSAGLFMHMEYFRKKALGACSN